MGLGLSDIGLVLTGGGKISRLGVALLVGGRQKVDRFVFRLSKRSLRRNPSWNEPSRVKPLG